MADSDELTLMTIDEVAAVARMNARTLQNRRSAGLPPFGFRAGRRVLYRRSEVLRWLNEAERTDSLGAGA